MVRRRPEIREKLYERRRERRKQLFETLRKQFINRFRTKFKDYLKRFIEESERYRTRLALLRDIVTGRANVVFKVTHVYFPRNVVEVQVRDRILMELPEDVRNRVIGVLKAISEGRGVDPTIFQTDPWLRYFITRYIAYYGKMPCKHFAYAVKLTPVTIHFFKGLRITYYFLRFSRAADVKADPYIGRDRPIDFIVTFIRYKYDGDFWNSLNLGEEGAGNYNDRTTVLRNHLRESEVKIPLRRAILQPHWVKYYFAKMLGKPEVETVVGHCSVYGILSRPSYTLKLYETGNRRLYGTRPRHRIKEILYSRGLRI